MWNFMKLGNTLFFICLIIATRDLLALDYVTATITITNSASTNGMTVTVNGNVRTFTNSVVVPSTQILTNNTIGGTATNMFAQFAANPFTGVLLSRSGTNGVIVSGQSLTASIVSSLGTVTLSTNVITSAVNVRVPMSVESSGQRAYIASQVAQGLGDYMTNRMTNITMQTPILVSPKFTNAVNYGNALVSAGSGTASSQFGSGTTALGDYSTAVGYSSGAWPSLSAVFGWGSAVYPGSASSVALGVGAFVWTNAPNSLAVGPLTSVNEGHTNSTAIGYGASTTAKYQIRLGVDTNTVSIPGHLDVAGGITNSYARLTNPLLTNGVNYGNPFRSPGAGANAEQFGISSLANGDYSIAFGNVALAYGYRSVAVGVGAQVQTNADYGLALGFGAKVYSNALFSTALGVNSTVNLTHSNSVAIGYNSSTTGSNQIVLGTSTEHVSIPGGLVVGGNITNAHFAGTNLFNAESDISFARKAITSLANGNNAGVIVGTNVFIEVSGPSAAFTINGIANGRDGKLIYIVNQTGFDMTVAHQSGTDPVAANRIIAMTGADRTTTANGAATLIYSGAASRWLLISWDP